MVVEHPDRRGAPPRREAERRTWRLQRSRSRAAAELRSAAATATAATSAAPRTYTVVSGDTLWAIAERFYGDGNKYQQIAEASGIANPDLIHPGQVVTIP